MRWIGYGCLMAWMGLSSPVWALEMELGQSYDDLNRGYADWRSTYLDGVHKTADGKTLYGGVRETERFSLSDRELLAGMYYPLDGRWTALAEANFSPSHKVLPQWSALMQIQRTFGHGWGVHLGARHTKYQNDDTIRINRGNFTIERYWGNYRAAYTFFANKIEGGGSPVSHAFQAAYYYGERNSLGMTYAIGSEVLNLPPAALAYYDVRSIALTGRYWFAPRWALTHEVALHEQGDLYTRKGIRLGVHYLF